MEDNPHEIIREIINFLNPIDIRSFSQTSKYINQICQYNLNSEKWIILNNFSDFIDYFKKGIRYVSYNNKVLNVINYQCYKLNSLRTIILSNGSILTKYDGPIKILKLAKHKYKMRALKMSPSIFS